MLEIILNEPIEKLVPKLISFNNEEIKNAIKPQLEKYKNTVYDESELPTAKADRANLNKFKDAIEDERKNIKKAYLVPYNNFETQVKEIVDLINDTTVEIDKQVKMFEDEKKKHKRAEIEQFWNDNIGDLKDLISLDKVFEQQWLNVTYSMKKVQMDICNLIDKLNSDLSAIKTLNTPLETRLIDFYLHNNLDIASALREKTRIEESEKKIAELKQNRAPFEQEQAEELFTVDFRIFATKRQVQLIKQFLVDNNIKYGKVPTNNKEI